MSLLVLSIEYLLLSIIFESLRNANNSKEELSETNQKSLNNDIIPDWKPLSYQEIEIIRSLTS